MGHRATVQALRLVYYGKQVDDLSLAQMAMIAGLPHMPSEFNPVSNLQVKKRRRNHVLTRMYRVGVSLPTSLSRRKLNR